MMMLCSKTTRENYSKNARKILQAFNVRLTVISEEIYSLVQRCCLTNVDNRIFICHYLLIVFIESNILKPIQRQKGDCLH